MMSALGNLKFDTRKIEAFVNIGWCPPKSVSSSLRMESKAGPVKFFGLCHF